MPPSRTSTPPPRKPYASVPRSNSSGSLSRCSSLKRDCGPGGGLRIRSSTPSSFAVFIHWLTAPLVTPKASAISRYFQPLRLSSKVLRRRPSRQSVAWLDSLFSVRSLSRSLGASAEISSYSRSECSQDEPRRLGPVANALDAPRSAVAVLVNCGSRLKRPLLAF